MLSSDGFFFLVRFSYFEIKSFNARREIKWVLCMPLQWSQRYGNCKMCSPLFFSKRTSARIASSVFLKRTLVLHFSGVVETSNEENVEVGSKRASDIFTSHAKILLVPNCGEEALFVATYLAWISFFRWGLWQPAIMCLESCWLPMKYSLHFSHWNFWWWLR